MWLTRRTKLRQQRIQRRWWQRRRRRRLGCNYTLERKRVIAGSAYEVVAAADEAGAADELAAAEEAGAADAPPGAARTTPA